MDRENKLGAEWSPELMAALKACRVFVPLYSRRYFESDNCGKEWFAFAQREVMHEARDGEAVSAIVPALWTHLDRHMIPVVAQSFQYDHADLGERYRAEGFYGIMKLRNYRADYQRAVHRLAERIIEIGDRSIAHSDGDVQGMERKDFESLPSAFGPASARRTTNSQLKITLLAHDTSNLPPGRASDYYGETPNAWSPYQPLILVRWRNMPWNWPRDAWIAKRYSTPLRMDGRPGTVTGRCRQACSLSTHGSACLIPIRNV